MNQVRIGRYNQLLHPQCHLDDLDCLFFRWPRKLYRIVSLRFFQFYFPRHESQIQKDAAAIDSGLQVFELGKCERAEANSVDVGSGIIENIPVRPLLDE